MAELKREQVRIIREQLLECVSVPKDAVIVNALCDLAIRAIEQNSAAQVSPKGLLSAAGARTEITTPASAEPTTISGGILFDSPSNCEVHQNSAAQATVHSEPSRLEERRASSPASAEPDWLTMAPPGKYTVVASNSAAPAPAVSDHAKIIEGLRAQGDSEAADLIENLWKLNVDDCETDTNCRKLLAKWDTSDNYGVVPLEDMIERLVREKEAAERDAERYRAALTTISQWDCLNPPQPKLLADLPWLRRVIDEALRK